MHFAPASCVMLETPPNFSDHLVLHLQNGGYTSFPELLGGLFGKVLCFHPKAQHLVNTLQMIVALIKETV